MSDASKFDPAADALAGSGVLGLAGAAWHYLGPWAALAFLSLVLILVGWQVRR